MHNHYFTTNSSNYIWECEFIKQCLSQNQTISHWLAFEGTPTNHLVQHIESQGGSSRARDSGPYPVRF